MNALITGVTGMVGSHLVDYLIENTDWDIYGFIRWNDKLDNLEHHFDKINKKDRIFLINGDLNDLPSVQAAVQESEADYIFHLAGQSSGEKSFEDPLDDLNRNFISTYNLISYAKENLIKNFFYASSMSVYGDGVKKARVKDFCKPLSYYGLHKKLSEDYIIKNLNNFNFIIF